MVYRIESGTPVHMEDIKMVIKQISNIDKSPCILETRFLETVSNNIDSYIYPDEPTTKTDISNFYSNFNNYINEIIQILDLSAIDAISLTDVLDKIKDTYLNELFTSVINNIFINNCNADISIDDFYTDIIDLIFLGKKNDTVQHALKYFNTYLSSYIANGVYGTEKYVYNDKLVNCNNGEGTPLGTYYGIFLISNKFFVLNLHINRIIELLNAEEGRVSKTSNIGKLLTELFEDVKYKTNSLTILTHIGTGVRERKEINVYYNDHLDYYKIKTFND